MNDTMMTECCAEFDTNYQAECGRSAKQAGFDPIEIFKLITTLLAQMCPKSASDLHAAASAGDGMTMTAINSATRLALREEHPGVLMPYARYNGRAIANAYRKTVASKDVETFQRSLDNIAR
jgi:hypothetical protein